MLCSVEIGFAKPQVVILGKAQNTTLSQVQLRNVLCAEVWDPRMVVVPGHAKDLKGERVRMPCFDEFAIAKAQVVKSATS